MIMAVGYKGPAILGTYWFEGMFDTDIDDFIHPTGDIAGGHCILVNRVNIRKGYFGLKNSWGPNWGYDGTCKVSFEDMEKLILTQGEVCVPVRRHWVDYL